MVFLFLARPPRPTTLLLLHCARTAALHPWHHEPLRFARSLLSGIAASARDDEHYAALRGLPASFGQEAAENALAGVVPSHSKGGWAVATFAGGCFWGTELHFQRLDGVICTCVGYTQGKVVKPSYEQVCTANLR